MCAPTSRGRMPLRTAMAAAVPTACPPTAQVAITRAEANAMCEALMIRPHMNRLGMLRE